MCKRCMLSVSKLQIHLFCFFLLLLFHAHAQINRLNNPVQIRANIKQHDYNHYNSIIHQHPVNIHNTAKFSIQQSGWQVKVSENKQQDFTDFAITFYCTQGSLTQSSIAVEIDVADWNEKNYVMMPAAVYNGNRYAWRRLRYSPKLHDIKDIGVDKPIIINDVPKLNDSSGISAIEERSGSMSVPCIAYYNHQQKNGMLLLSQQANSFGDYGIGIKETRNRNKATISISSPVVRENYCYLMTNAHYPSWDKPADFKKGDTIRFQFRIYNYASASLQGLFDKFAAIRKSYIKDTAYNDVLPYAEVMHTLEQKFNQYNFVDSIGYYSIGMRENYLQDWQIGWTGGMISTYPLLFSGNEQTQKNVLRSFDWLFPNGISPSGFYYDAGQKGKEWITGDIRNFHTKNWHLIRKSGDAVWYITKQFMLMEKQHIPVKNAWKDGNKKVCDAFVTLWNKYKQTGQFVDAYTGEIIVGGSSSGAIVPAALTLAAAYYQEPVYLETAKQLGQYFYENFTQKGIACGGPGDALQAFDSESAYALVESYTYLYEHTKEQKWLKYAEEAAKQFSTWVVSYNYHFNDTTAFAKLNIKTIGSVYANIQNKHTAPGICTASGLALLKLYRSTGNSFYLNLLRDIAHNITQYVPHQYNPIPNTPVGWVSERVNMTDWEGPGTIGYILPMSTWAETSVMLTTIEVPGIYIDVMNKNITMFDNLKLKNVEFKNQQVQITLYNPTKAKASFSCLLDTDRSVALQENYLFGTERFDLNAGETKVFTIKY